MNDWPEPNRPDEPCLPLPAPLRGADEGSFAEYTVTSRFPQTVTRVLADNAFPPVIVARLNQLRLEIPAAPLRPLQDGAADNTAWGVAMAPYLGQNWLEAPWLPVEIYFYRRILEATGFFQPGPGEGIDPFKRQKEKSLRESVSRIEGLCARTAALDRELTAESLARLMQLALWGNQADMSLFPAGSGEQPEHADEAMQRKHTLVDDTMLLWNYLQERRRPLSRIDFILDNAGFELVGDLILADFLLASGTTWTVRLHLKPQPFFVSDAMPDDCSAAIGFLRRLQAPEARALGRRLREVHARGRLQLRSHHFWIMPFSMWAMPADLRSELATSALLISKGDANYRRWLGDRHWLFTTSFDRIVCYTPAPLIALRTLKSNVAAGLPAGRVAELNRVESDWLISGRYGVIQFSS